MHAHVVVSNSLLLLPHIGLVGSIVGYVGIRHWIMIMLVGSGSRAFCNTTWLFGLGIRWKTTRSGSMNIIPFPLATNSTRTSYDTLTRLGARDFLKIISSFPGLIEPFSNPDLSLYYNVPRKRLKERVPDIEYEHNHSAHNEPENAGGGITNSGNWSYISRFSITWNVRHEFTCTFKTTK